MVITSRIENFCLIDQLFSEKEIYQAFLARNILLSGIRNCIIRKKTSGLHKSSKSNKEIMDISICQYLNNIYWYKSEKQFLLY